jgi:hypothetical protein
MFCCRELCVDVVTTLHLFAWVFHDFPMLHTILPCNMMRSYGLFFKLFGHLSPLANTYMHWTLSVDVHILFSFFEFLNPQVKLNIKTNQKRFIARDTHQVCRPRRKRKKGQVFWKSICGKFWKAFKPYPPSTLGNFNRYLKSINASHHQGSELSKIVPHNCKHVFSF